MNGDRQPDYGSCIPKKRNHVGHWMLWSVAGSFLQSQGTQQGAFFDPKTMKPLINNEAFAKALDVYKQTGEYAPPNELQWNLSTKVVVAYSVLIALTGTLTSGLYWRLRRTQRQALSDRLLLPQLIVIPSCDR